MLYETVLSGMLFFYLLISSHSFLVLLSSSISKHISDSFQSYTREYYPRLMQLSVLSSIGLLSLVGHHVQANPIATTSNICTLPWVKLGELALNLLPSSEGPRLCSSVLYKYATTTRKHSSATGLYHRH